MEFPKLKTNTKIYSSYTKDGTGFILAKVIKQFKAYKIEFADENEPDDIFIPNSNHDGKEEVEPVVLDLKGLTTWRYAEEQNDDEEEVERPVTMEEDRLEEEDFVELEFDIGKNQKKWFGGVVTEELDAFLVHFCNKEGGNKDDEEDKQDKKKKKKDDEYVFLIQFPEEEITQLYLEEDVQFRKVQYDENNEDHRKLILRRFEDNCALIDEQCEALEEEVANCEYHKHLLNQRIASIESENSSFSQVTFNEEKLAKKKEFAGNIKKSAERLVEAIDKGLVIKLDAQERFTSQFKSFLNKKKGEHYELLQDSLSKYFGQDDTSEYDNTEYSHLKTCLLNEFLPTLNSQFQKFSKKLEYINCKKSYEKVENILDRLKENVMIQKGIKKEMEHVISKELSAHTKTNKKRGNPESGTPLPHSKKRRRGRPKKGDVKTPSASKPAAISPSSSSANNKKKKRGRPRKDAIPESASKKRASNGKKRGRGRPKKDSSMSPPQTKRGRGRPRKNSSPGESLTSQQLSEAMHPPQSPASVYSESSVDSPSSVQTHLSEDY
ncbi:DUF55-domain-containing protein [Chaetoceros tenuissimus]|uniref:DUF55-domain-containing protein n=1 Tax=Chaetoceros tenuissimus TaxID=426638 RepID=A0AAD3CQZ0_9STRA|nr:DUF55-domain-containing protein [Chaetoceros tenuissimus]